MIHPSVLPSIEIPELPITSYVMEHALEHADRPALIDGPSDRTYTYGQLDDLIRRFAGGLQAKGFGSGHVLAIMSPNLPEYAIVFHGAAFAGGVVTTINPTYTEQEIRHQLESSGATILVTIGMFLDIARQAADGTKVESIYVIGEADGAASVLELFGEPMSEQVPVELDDVVVLPYSSGTTGLSKGVMLTHRNLVSNVAQSLTGAEVVEGDVIMAVLPFFHIYGMQVLMNLGLRAGAKIVTMPRFDLELFLELHQKHHVTHSFVAPPIVVALAKHPIVDNYDLSSLKFVMSGAAPLSAELAAEATARIGCEVVQGYGMTESSPVTQMAIPGRYKPGSVGLTTPNTDMRFVDPATGEDLGVGADGELWIRGPQIMKGYLNNPEATAATIDDEGWLHTGDIGHIDDEGFVFIVDRLKELIKYKGFQVPPAELEALLLTHPAVADSAVIGIPDPEAGEIPVGYVVLKPGQDVAPEDIQAFVADKVASYKKLRKINIVDAIPKSASGKILRRVLKDEAAGKA